MTSTEIGTQLGEGGRVLSLSRCALVVLSGERKGHEVVMDRDLLRVGKSEESDLLLPDATVSRVHCEIVRDSQGYRVRDLDSTNGTRVDGARIREAYLAPGQVLTVGKVDVAVRPFAERIALAPSTRDSFGLAVGRSHAMREIFGLLERIAKTEATVLLGGETGTGKDVLARSIHAESARAKKPFVVVDCGAVVGPLIESELFGHERGAFTGATSTRRGAFELAHGGTLFLDEIGELPLDLQPKLLRALEQRSFRRVGGNQEIRVDIRIVAASKRNLRLEVERGKFREDLYFRLSVVPIEVPPLRERKDDLPLLVDTLLASLSRPDEPRLQIDPAAMAALRTHDWPGNVRELRNVLERAALVARSMGETTIGPSQVPFVGTARPPGGPDDGEPPFDPSKSYRDVRAEFEERFERRYVAWLLERHGGNISAAARAADMDRKYLHRLAKKHGLHPADAEDV
ncbi:MAG: sigma 54-interacting transcriptional regulator [Polyangiales bacterium]